MLTPTHLLRSHCGQGRGEHINQGGPGRAAEGHVRQNHAAASNMSSTAAADSPEATATDSTGCSLSRACSICSLCFIHMSAPGPASSRSRPGPRYAPARTAAQCRARRRPRCWRWGLQGVKVGGAGTAVRAGTQVGAHSSRPGASLPAHTALLKPTPVSDTHTLGSKQPGLSVCSMRLTVDHQAAVLRGGRQVNAHTHAFLNP